jgi:hypothetical protein
MKKSKKAILWGRDDLLSKAMEMFLTAEETWKVVKVPVERGRAWLFEQAKSIKPGVIILYSENCLEDSSLPLKLIQDQPNLRVVTVSQEGNQMQVYSKHSILVREAADLLSIIEDRYFFSHQLEEEVDQEQNRRLNIKRLTSTLLSTGDKNEN